MIPQERRAGNNLHGQKGVVTILDDHRIVLRPPRPQQDNRCMEGRTAIGLRSNVPEQMQERAVFLLREFPRDWDIFDSRMNECVINFFSTREYPRDCGLCHFCMNEREIDCIAVLRSNACEQTRDRAVFFHREKFRETKIYVISAWTNARYFFFYARISARLQIVSFPHERTWHKYFFYTQEYLWD